MYNFLKILCILGLLINGGNMYAQQIAEPTIDSQFLQDNGLLPLDNKDGNTRDNSVDDEAIKAAAEAVKQAAVEATSDNENEDDSYAQEEQKELEQITQEAIKNSAPTQWRQIDSSSWNKLIADEAFNYAREKKKLVEKKPEPKKEITAPFKINPNVGIVLLYALTAMVILVILYSFFGNRFFGKKDIAIEPLANNDWEDVQQFDKWDEAINNAVAQKDFRLATRILYLQSISKLDAANIIKYKKETTNSAYASSLFNASCYQPFIITTRIYDYVWYGKREIGATQFVEVKQAFDNFNNMIS
jgi:hypothetical protein